MLIPLRLFLIFLPLGIVLPAQAGSTTGPIQVSTGKCLDVHLPDITKNGAVVQIWACTGAVNQNWRFDDDGRLVNGGGLCLDVELTQLGRNGGKVQVWACHSGPNQKWGMNLAGEIRSNPKIGNVCLDVHAPEVSNNGGKVQIWGCWGAQNQHWNFAAQASGEWCGNLVKFSTILNCVSGTSCRSPDDKGLERIDLICR